MIGLIDNAVASSALAPPIRPPFLRFSNVSSAPNSLVRVTSSSARPATASGPAEPAAASAQAMTMVPRPIDSVRLSITRTEMPSAATVRAASSALWNVADSAPDRVRTRISGAPAPASAR